METFTHEHLAWVALWRNDNIAGVIFMLLAHTSQIQASHPYVFMVRSEPAFLFHVHVLLTFAVILTLTAIPPPFFYLQESM